MKKMPIRYWCEQQCDCPYCHQGVTAQRDIGDCYYCQTEGWKKIKKFKGLMSRYGLTIRDLPAIPPKSMSIKRLIIVIGRTKIKRKIEVLKQCLNYAYHRVAKHERSGLKSWVRESEIQYWRRLLEIIK